MALTHKRGLLLRLCRYRCYDCYARPVYRYTYIYTIYKPMLVKTIEREEVLWLQKKRFDAIP